MPRDIFTNRGSTTVSSGGTDSPSAGTTQSWTVSSSSSFPAASNSATPATRFYVADPDQPSELILVTNVSGTTWSVTRGADGTTPVSHSGGFTVKNVVPATWFNEIEDRLKARTFDVLEYEATGLGSVSETAAFQAAMDAAGTYAAANGSATLVIPPGKYKLSTSSVTLSANVKVFAYGAYIFSGTSDVSMFAKGGSGGYTGGPIGFEWHGGIIDAKGQSAATDAGYNIFSLTNGRNIVFRDVTFRNVASWHCLDLSAIDTALIDNCRFEGFTDKTSGLTRQYSESIQIDNDNADSTPTKNVTVRNCYMGPAIDGSGLGSFGAFVGGHTDAAGFVYSGMKITGNRIDSPISTGIRPRSWSDSQITDNTITGGCASGFGAIHCANGADNVSRKLTITGNIIEDCEDTGIRMSGTSGRTFEGCIVARNTIRTAGGIAIMATNVHESVIATNIVIDSGSDAIEVATCSDTVVSNNEVFDAGVHGIQVDASTRCSVTGNNLYTVGQRGIWLANSSTLNTIRGNTIVGAGRTTNATYGCIEISNTGNNGNTIAGNICRKFGSGNEALTPIVVAGTTPSENYVVGNIFVGWSSTHSSNFTLNSNTTVRTEIDGTATANSVRAS